MIEGNELSIEANFLKPTTATVIVVGSGSVNTEGVEYASTINGQPIVVNIKITFVSMTMAIKMNLLQY